MSALIWCPFADEDSAVRAAGTLLDEGLAACVNIIPGIRSLYRWQGERGEASECAALFKTDTTLLDRAVARLEAIHPYDCPAVVGWQADATGLAAAQWLGGLSSQGQPA